MSNIMTYKRHVSRVEYDDDDGIYTGRIAVAPGTDLGAAGDGVPRSPWNGREHGKKSLKALRTP